MQKKLLFFIKLDRGEKNLEGWIYKQNQSGKTCLK